MRQWLLLFVDYMANKQIQAGVLNYMTGGSDRLCMLSGDVLDNALATLIARAKQSGEIVLAVEPIDLLCAVAGIASFGADLDGEVSAKRLVDIMIAGLRNGTSTGGRW
ncbi:hypothetical protein [Cupriavidus sp. BIC8F]|uniref:SbtR family transcriptional regulator n=1 Tax=Cupriavidus sp. BIC8F TaxID=3079014 RepID=UPI0029166627|nr:hypothetical protein [Cupriavidus sp. BIC8F]